MRIQSLLGLHVGKSEKSPTYLLRSCLITMSVDRSDRDGAQTPLQDPPQRRSRALWLHPGIAGGPRGRGGRASHVSGLPGGNGPPPDHASVSPSRPPRPYPAKRAVHLGADYLPAASPHRGNESLPRRQPR